MGGSGSKALAKKATRPLKNIFLEERAQKAIEKHKTKPTPAPRHQSTEKLIKQQIDDNPHIKEELIKEDLSLIDRVNKLHLHIADDTPKYVSKDRPLPLSKDHIADPMKAFEDPKRVMKGKISYRMLYSILNKQGTEAEANQPLLFKQEVVAKEYNLDVKDVADIIQYFKAVDLEQLLEEAEQQEQEPYFSTKHDPHGPGIRDMITDKIRKGTTVKKNETDTDVTTVPTDRQLKQTPT